MYTLISESFIPILGDVALSFGVHLLLWIFPLFLLVYVIYNAIIEGKEQPGNNKKIEEK